MTRFLHTADWQLGKPFASVDDAQKRFELQRERFAVLQRIGQLAHNHGAEFLLAAGDLFDSPNATAATVSQACAAIGEIGLPVYAIPGNHDHGGPGSLWEQEFFLRESAALAPNLRVLTRSEPVEVGGAWLFPCPLLRRQEISDPTFWLRSLDDVDPRWAARPRIAVAHGSVTSFGGFVDDEEAGSQPANQIDLDRLPQQVFDYLALGDWHGAKQAGPKAWYAGTPEPDRFAKGEDQNPGNVLLVEAARGQLPRVQILRTAAIGWHDLEWTFTADTSLESLRDRVEQLAGHRVGRDLLRLRLSGALGLETFRQLEELLETWRARLLRLRLENETALAPTGEELDSLTRRSSDPLVARVAARLSALARGEGEPAATARQALRELYLACSSNR